jgi:integrase
MSSLKDYIKNKRPTLSASSITTYGSILKSLYKKCFGDEDIDFKKFDDTECILGLLKDLPPNKRKTILSALVIITDNQKYRDLMLSDVREYNQEIKKQEKTPTQEENWASEEDILKLWNDYKKEATSLYKKDSLNMNDLQIIQSFIILSLLGGMFIPPRRAKDMTDFKIKSINKNTDNYIEKGNLVFNSYKTSKTYGRQEVPIPKPLHSILKKWIKVNPTEYLLFDTNGNPLTSVKLNQRLNRIFDGRKIAINALRHSFLTTKYKKHSEQSKALANDMEDMGSSTSMADTYIKLN